LLSGVADGDRVVACDSDRTHVQAVGGNDRTNYFFLLLCMAVVLALGLS
jgi:hypothetical protein